MKEMNQAIEKTKKESIVDELEKIIEMLPEAELVWTLAFLKTLYFS